MLLLFEPLWGAVLGQLHKAPLRHAASSVLGGERKGVVMRLADRLPGCPFPLNTCKNVRAGHVQTGEHQPIDHAWNGDGLSGQGRAVMPHSPTSG